MVAPAARARLKKAAIAGRGISNWLTATSPFASVGAATSAASTSALAPGMTTMVLSALAMVMIAVPVWASAVCCTKLEVDPLRGEERLQLVAERILAEPADQRRRRAEFGGGDRLVGALAAGKIKHRVAGDGFADAGMPVGGCHHIHVDAAGNENAAHALFPKALAQTRTPNSCLTASMSASVGNPASLPSRWIL